MGKNMVYIGFGTIRSFRLPLGVLEHTLIDKGNYCIHIHVQAIVWM